MCEFVDFGGCLGIGINSGATEMAILIAAEDHRCLTHWTLPSFSQTMAEKEKPNPLLSKPLFIYSLPTELLNTLTLKGDVIPQDEQITKPAKEVKQENSEAGGTGCVTCNIPSFVHVTIQREHFRSDLHKFNLKRKLAGQKPVSAEEFDKMLDGILRQEHD